VKTYMNTLSKSRSFQFSTAMILVPIALTLGIWIVFWSEIRFGFNFTTLGVRPRTLSGLVGVLCSPFIHGDIEHLWHNTIPIFVLSMALFYFYRDIAVKVLVFIILCSGLGTWLIGRDSFHIGMSGVIYGLVSFLFFKGILTKHYRLIALSLIVVFFYGSLIWGTLPVDPKISWEGHLSGFVVGLVLALYFRKNIPEKPKYKWEQEDYKEEDDPFMKHFDADGNFIEFPENEESVEIIYHYAPKRKSEEEE